MKKFIALTLALVTAYAIAEPKPYEATAADQDLQTLLTRWAQVEGKNLVWEVNIGNAPLLNAEAVSLKAGLQSASSFEQAFVRLNTVLLDLSESSPSSPLPFQACIFSDAIVIRTIKQPRCGLPL